MPGGGSSSGSGMNYDSMRSGCASSGGTWMGSYCKMPGSSALPKKYFLGNVSVNLLDFLKSLIGQ